MDVFLDTCISTLTQGLIYALLSCGIYITYKILDFPDLTVDGSFPLGAAVTAVVSPARAAFLENRPLSPEEAVGRIRGVDLILTEGFKTGPWPKLALCRAGSAPAVPLERCAALVTDAPPEDCPVPVFPIQDPMPLARWLARQRKERE